ncbi:MAG: adenosine deaminase [Bacteroides sp.]|nr:adenosine deaminase [Bacteroides sp.]MBD5425058.1 adenosine deaminase [Bacteroides sp.]MDE6223081.1 adenine-specific methyltransferase EcoRI family protein [Muribaculaceae bacterium]
MSRKGSNSLLHNAKSSKSDEFYTLMPDIERELAYYRNAFSGKVVYCNCDDPERSNFFLYFKQNFHKLGLKKLIASCYNKQAQDLFSPASCCGHYCIYDGSGPVELRDLKGDGDFRSSECTQLLEDSDIVVTNPPFSLFREFLNLLVNKKKLFLIIANINALTYRETFSLIKDNKIWLGVHMGRGISGFLVPDYYDLFGTETSIGENGERIISPNNCLWLTNLDVEVRHEKIELTKSYEGNEGSYSKFDNYEGININFTKDIPKDYAGDMGVPITFLHKYNPNQFEIVRFRKGDDGKDLRVNGKCPYFRIIVRNRLPVSV